MTNSINLKLILFLLLMLILLSIIFVLHLYFKNFNSNNIILASYNQNINADSSDVIDWFYDLEDYPDRYKFDTHKGIYFINNDSLPPFGSNGSKFYTKEKLLFFTKKLKFRMENIKSNSFEIFLEDSIFPIKGKFLVTKKGNKSNLQIDIITNKNNLYGKILHLPFIKNTIYNQIKKEIYNIKKSIEILS